MNVLEWQVRKTESWTYEAKAIPPSTHINKDMAAEEGPVICFRI